MKPPRWIIAGVSLLTASLGGAEKSPPVEVRRITPEDSGILEAWERVTSEPDVSGVGAAKSKHPKWQWSIFVSAAEFVRTEPLAGRLEKDIVAALKKVARVKSVAREDTEVWLVEGDANGEDLVRACAAALDQLAPEIRKLLKDLNEGSAR